MTPFENDDILSAYLDGELEPAEAARVAERLASDPQAARLVEELRALGTELRRLPRQTLGAAFAQRVLADVTARDPVLASASSRVDVVSRSSADAKPDAIAARPSTFDQFHWRRTHTILAGFGTLAAVVLVGFFILRSRPDHGSVAQRPSAPAVAESQTRDTGALAREGFGDSDFDSARDGGAAPPDGRMAKSEPAESAPGGQSAAELTRPMNDRPASAPELPTDADNEAPMGMDRLALDPSSEVVPDAPVDNTPLIERIGPAGGRMGGQAVDQSEALSMGYLGAPSGLPTGIDQMIVVEVDADRYQPSATDAAMAQLNIALEPPTTASHEAEAQMAGREEMRARRQVESLEGGADGAAADQLAPVQPLDVLLVHATPETLQALINNLPDGVSRSILPPEQYGAALELDVDALRKSEMNKQLDASKLGQAGELLANVERGVARRLAPDVVETRGGMRYSFAPDATPSVAGGAGGGAGLAKERAAPQKWRATDPAAPPPEMADAAPGASEAQDDKTRGAAQAGLSQSATGAPESKSLTDELDPVPDEQVFLVVIVPRTAPVPAAPAPSPPK
jgi:negative regulator of sigma E activity